MQDDRARLNARLHELFHTPAATARAALDDLIAPDAAFHIGAPVETLSGGEALWRGWLDPLRRAFTPVRVHDLLVLGGTSAVGEGGRWLASLSHLTGRFSAPLFGLAPHDKLARLRIGAFYRIEGGRIVRAYILPDLLDLADQAGRLNLAHLGAALAFPAPLSQTGLCPDADAERSAQSLALVEGMLGDLHAFDPETYQSRNQFGADGYWHPDMLWYGPAPIGGNVGYQGFDDHHRVPFLRAFPDRKGGNHFARFADGDFVCSGGWPSMTMSHRGDYFGIPASERAMTLRVMDFWRCADGQIRENWVLLDMVELFRAMGRDVWAEALAA